MFSSPEMITSQRLLSVDVGTFKGWEMQSVVSEAKISCNTSWLHRCEDFSSSWSREILCHMCYPVSISEEYHDSLILHCYALEHSNCMNHES